MKKILTRIFDKKRFVFVFGLLIGVVLMGGVSRGLDEYTSAGVSYTGKDGTTVSVKQALDDLITKSSKIDTLEKQVSDYEKQVSEYKKLTIYLADQVKVGDYVAYDAGNWSITADKPTEQGKFGGYTKNQSKNKSVACYESSAPSYNGWRVLTVNKTTHDVTIVHAGQPECYYHKYGNGEASAQLLQGHTNVYVNTTYAQSDHIMTKDEAEKITGNTNSTEDTLRKTGAYYWLATAYSNNTLWDVRNTGVMYNSSGGGSWGIRPVVVLKSGVLTTGQGKDSFGNTAWQLVAPK